MRGRSDRDDHGTQQANPRMITPPRRAPTAIVTGQGVVGGAAGDADVDGGKTTLTTPLLDLSHVAEARVTLLALVHEQPRQQPEPRPVGRADLGRRRDLSWVDLENTTVSANSWTQKSFAIANYVTLTNQIVFRFVAEDAGAGGSLVEAAVDDFEIEGLFSPMDAEEAAEALSLRLDAARPNPVTGQAVIFFSIPDGGPVALDVFGVDGRHVRTLASGTLAPGRKQAIWDCRNDAGAEVAPGIYFYKLASGGREITRRLTLVR